MNLFDELFTESIAGTTDGNVDATEMIGCFYDIVNIDNLIFKTNGIRFKDVASLIMSQLAPLNMIGVVGQFNLNLVIDTT